MTKSLKDQFRARAPLFGGWTSLGHPSITEAMTMGGIDFLGIDLEHSTISLEQSQTIIALSQSASVPCLPRISSHNPEQIKRLLDSGADGVIIPMISTLDETVAMVNAIKYPPVGKRSYGVARAQSYGKEFDSYTKTWNEKSTIIVQIESIEGVKNVDAILSNENVDGAMIGPYDLSGSLNIPGQLTHPDVVKASQAVIDACKRHNKACGTQVIEPNKMNVKEALAKGFTFVVLASDVFLLWKWAEQMKKVTQFAKGRS